MLNSDLCVRLDTRPAAALVPRYTCPECRVAAYRRAALRAALGMNGGGKVNACPRSSRVRGRRSRVSRGRVSQKSAQAVVYTSRPSSVGRPRPLADVRSRPFRSVATGAAQAVPDFLRLPDERLRLGEDGRRTRGIAWLRPHAEPG